MLLASFSILYTNLPPLDGSLRELLYSRKRWEDCNYSISIAHRFYQNTKISEKIWKRLDISLSIKKLHKTVSIQTYRLPCIGSLWFHQIHQTVNRTMKLEKLDITVVMSLAHNKKGPTDTISLHNLVKRKQIPSLNQRDKKSIIFIPKKISKE